MMTRLLVLVSAWLIAAAGLCSAENHPPTIDPVAAQSLVEDQSPVVLTLKGIGSGDPAAAGQTMTLGVAIDDPTLLAVDVTYAGGTSAILVLTPRPDRSGASMVRITLHDDGGGSDTTMLAIPVTLSAVDDPPSATVPATWTLNEDETDPVRLRIICSDLRAGPADESGQTVTASAWPFFTNSFLVDPPEISGTTLTIPIRTLPNRAAVSYLLLLRLQDGTNTTDYSILVTINPVPDRPSIVAGPAVTVATGSAVRLTTADLAVFDPDGDTVTVTVRSIPAHGVLRFDGAALAVGSTFNASSLDVGDTSLTYQHDGSTSAADSASFACSDTAFPVPGIPVTLAFQIGGRARPWVNLPGYGAWAESGGPVLLFPAGEIVDPDSPSFAGGSIQVAIIDHAVDKIVLDIANQGDAPGQVGRTGTEVRVGGHRIGTVSPGHGVNPLVVTFAGASASQSAVLAVLRAVTFDVPLNNGINYPIVEVVVDDGQDGRSRPATMTIYTSENLDELPLLPAGLRLATLTSLTRTYSLGAYEPDGSSNAPVWSVNVQPANATITMLTTTTESGPRIRLVPTAAGTGEVVFKVLDSNGRSALTTVPVLVLASIDEARPHPQAEGPREVLAGDAVDVVVPWDARDVASDAVLSFAATGTAPAGLVLTVLGDRQVRVTWPVPAATTPGSRYRFQVLAEDPTRGVMGFLPFDVLVRARPDGGG